MWATLIDIITGFENWLFFIVLLDGVAGGFKNDKYEPYSEGQSSVQNNKDEALFCLIDKNTDTNHIHPSLNTFYILRLSKKSSVHVYV